MFGKEGFSDLFQENLKNFDWNSKKSALFVNPRLPKEKQFLLQKSSFPSLPGHVWLSSSGAASFHHLKLVALSKEALLISAENVNQHIESDSSDIWLNVLPFFHVGGLSIYARAYLSQAQVISYEESKWSAKKFFQSLHQYKVTLTSLVPTQLKDLMDLNLKAPRNLRVVFVGGDFLHRSLYVQARKKGWNILPTYGMTECASQVATAPFGSLNKGNPSFDDDKDPSLLQVLPHVEVKVKKNRDLLIKSPSLFTGWNLVSEKVSQFEDPKQDDWFQTEDKGYWVESNQTKLSLRSSFTRDPFFPSYLKIQGRSQNRIKVGGELVDLKNLSDLFEILMINRGFSFSFLFVAMPSSRLGSQVDLVLEVSSSQNWRNGLEVLREFQQQVSPYERVKTIYGLEKIPRTPLLKPSFPLLLKQLKGTEWCDYQWKLTE